MIGDEEEVEQLLKAAQDEVLLKLSIDSHMSRVSPDYLLSDLDRRFQALKSTKQTHSTTKQPPPSRPPEADPKPNGDDLLARFAALKASSSAPQPQLQLHSDDDDEEDEVEKIIRWAKDAARLDPSPPSDDDDDDGDYLTETDGDDDEEFKNKKQKKKLPK
ncbi:hypothetical protein M5689_020012 [Euphorbia peplus]|nr:hypothetical protein M5689_020012 [Euphorbia peplus]